MIIMKSLKRTVSVLTIMTMLLVAVFSAAAFAEDSTSDVQLTAPQNVKATYLSYENCFISWDPVDGANAYKVFIKKPTGETEDKWVVARGNNGYENNGGGTTYLMFETGVYTISVAAVIDHYDGSPIYGPTSTKAKVTKVKQSVTWKKPKKNGRFFTIKWKKDKRASGYILRYSFIKSSDRKIESKIYTKTISSKKTSFKLKKMPKKYDTVWISMRPYIKANGKKLYWEVPKSYEITKKGKIRKSYY